MDAFGVRFRVNNIKRFFETLRLLYAEIRKDKCVGKFRNASKWVQLVPDEIKRHFSWPTPEDREHWLTIRHTAIIQIPDPAQQLGAVWDFYRVFEAIDESDYDLLKCEMVNNEVAEMQIDPHGYPYGGVGPLIELAEAFGFVVLVVNECGRLEYREELLGGRRDS